MRSSTKMKGIDWRLFCLMAFPLTLGLAEETATSNDLKTDGNSIDNKENEEARSGVVLEGVEPAETVANPEIQKISITSDVAEATDNETSETKRFLMGNLKESGIVLNGLGYVPPGQIMDQLSPLDRKRFPDQNEYKYEPNPNLNVQNANQILTYNGVPDSDNMSANQILVSGSNNKGMSFPRSGAETDGDDQNEDESQEAYSRLIPYSERILLHQIPGANNLITCTREGELHNFWSSAYQCLVCACIRDTGVLRPVCASCAGCMRPEVVEVDIPITPGNPSIPVTYTTPTPPLEEQVTCRPLPSGKPFDNPLHPCQVCICMESINIYGKPDVHIKCQENPQCVLPTDVTVLPSIPDVPVPSPFCDKFPLNVLFPHPSDSCKTCRCSVQMTQLGVSEKQITCLPNPDCTPNTEIITELPVTPSYPISVEPQITLKPVSELEPFYGTGTPKPSPWTPATVPPHLGPLPGPSPHDSCRPYIPNQPFQHPWDDCQMCVCTEAIAKKHVTVEISCFTKKSCCVEPPFDIVTPATLPPMPYKQSGKLKFADAICEYTTFGVEFVHPKDPCNICTCELQGRLITPLCKRSSEPECQLVSIYPTTTSSLAEIIHENKKLPPPGSISYNAGSSSSSQNNAIKNAFVSYQNPYGSSGLQVGSSLSSADQHASYNQWNLQNLQRPGDLGYKTQNQIPGGPQNFQPSLVYGPQSIQPGNSQYYGPQSMGYPHYNPGQHGYQGKPGAGAYAQNYYPESGQHNRGFPGYPPGLLRPTEVIAQAQTKASVSASATAATGLKSNSYAYAPGFQYPGQGLGYPVKKGIRQFAQSSASAQSSAQASSMAATKYRGRSGTPDHNEPADKEN